jgi:hypothetical protein
MQPVSITESVRLTGKSRATLYRMINKGTLSATQTGSGEKVIDPAELIRAFGELKGHDNGGESHEVSLMKHHETHKGSRQSQVQSEQIQILTDQIKFLQNEFVEMRKREQQLISILDRKLLSPPDRKATDKGDGKKKKKKKKKKR